MDYEAQKRLFLASHDRSPFFFQSLCAYLSDTCVRQSGTGELARNLIERTKLELESSPSQRQLIELIETIVIYKFPQLSYEEIETMLNLEEIRQTKVYQDAKEEGQLEQKLAMIPLLRELGLDTVQIAQRLELSEEVVEENS